MSAPDGNDAGQPAGAALLAGLKARLEASQGRDAPIYRVVEITREPDGRLRRQGRIWHADLDQVRRFGRAVAANSAGQQVVIADATGGVVEELPVAPVGAVAPAGWTGWREIALPPAPPRKKPRLALRPPAATPAPAAPAAEPVVAVPVVDAALPAATQGIHAAVPAAPEAPSATPAEPLTITASTRKPPPRDLPVVQAEVATLSGAAATA